MESSTGSRHTARDCAFALLVFLLLASLHSFAAIAVDTVSSGTISYVQGTSGPLTFSHTSAANSYLVVAVSMNVNNSGGATIGSVTYNSVAMTPLGADTANARRVEYWGIGVTSATTADVVITPANVNNRRRVGIVAGAITFTGADPVNPVGVPSFATGTNRFPTITVGSSANQLILDTVATARTVTVTQGSGQTQQWTDTSGTSNNNDARGAGSTGPGATSVTMSETLSGNSNWVIGAIAILGPATGTLCANPGNDGVGNVTGVVNAYYSPSADVVLGPGSTSVDLSPGVGAGMNINAGDLLLIIQMQDTDINSSNDERYGDGSGTPGNTTGNGSGYTNLNSAGIYEYVVAANSVTFAAGGTLNFTGAGAGSGLLNTFTQAAFQTGTKGQSSFQVIRVPQYSAATLGNGGNVTVARAWDGSAGGIFAIDVSGVLTLNGTVNVDALGFRGGGGRVLTGGTGAATDYRTASSDATNGGKGEGIAGTPQYMISSTGTLINTTIDGYPNGSYARGAPGNAGGGGTDANPPANDENDGGGGGGNGGAGGMGGNSWNSNLPSGGWGGAVFPATVARVSMGGGGGAGTTNNGTSDPNTNTTGINSSGGTGGGLVLIRTSEVAGTGTITANGANTLNTQNDSTGGGGAGGTIVVVAQHGGLSGLTAVAKGGNGGTAWATQGPGTGCPGGGACNYHGPGGGGGGGVVILSAAPASADVSGGLNGTTTTAKVAYGAMPGDAGIVITNATLGGMGGASSGSQCVPDLTISGTGLGNLLRGSTWSYNLSVSNLGILNTSGQVQVNDTLPFGLSVTSASGTGWSCNQLGQAVSCTRSDALSGFGTSYPAINLIGTVAQSAPDSPTNTATTSGGGETYLGNDSATATPNIFSVGDLSLTSTATPNLVPAGGTLSYTQQVANLGPSDAAGLFFTSVIPANTTFQSITVPNGWTCTTPPIGSAGIVSCVASSLAAGGNSTFTIVTTVNNGVSNGTILTNNASVGALTSDPFAANNFTQTSVTVGTAAQSDLALTNVAVPTTVAVGNQITFTHVLTYTGPSNATNLVYTEAVPANTTLVTLPNPGGPWTCSGTSTITCTAASITSGSTYRFATVVQVTGGTTISDTGTITSTPADSFAGNNTATATVTVASSGADISVSDQASPVTVEAGNSMVFSHMVANNGPNVSGTVTMTDTLPAGTTYQSVTAPPGWNCSNLSNVVTCTASALGVSSAASIEVTTFVPTTTGNGTILTDSVTVSNSTGDPVSGNNTATASSTVTTATDVGVTISGSPDPVLTTGGPLAITANVFNNGPTNAGNTTFKITVPANTSYVSTTAPDGTWICNPPSGGVVVCTAADVAVGYNKNFVLNLTVGALPANTVITSTANIVPGVSDKIPANNTAVFTTTVAASTQTELAMSLASTPVPVTAGSTLTLDGIVTNKGPSPAANPSLTFPIPSGTTLTGYTVPGATCSVAGGTLTCSSTTALPVGSVNVQFVLKVNSNDTAAIVAGATVTSTTLAPNGLPANATASVTTPVITSADLSVSNACTPDQSVNNNIVCSQVITDLGPSDAQGVVLTEAVPTNTTFVSATGATCTLSSGTVTCTVGTVAVGTPVTITFTTKINAGVPRGTKITDTVNVTATTSDPIATNNSASASTTVALATDADIAVTNTPSTGSILAGNNITYTQKITNNGLAASGGLTINESTPPNTTFVSIAPGSWTCTGVPPVGGTGSFNCTLGAGLAANASSTVTMVLNTNAGTTPGTVISDTLTSPALPADPDGSNNSAIANTVIQDPTQADVSVTISGNTTVRDGMSDTFTIVGANAGPATATNVIVTMPLPDLEQFVSVTPAQGSCSVNGSTVTCALGSLSSGANATITLVVNAIGFGVTSNTASIVADQTDPNLANNTASLAMLILAPTEVKLVSFDATWGNGKVVLTWQTKEEARNLGFNVYREVNGVRVKLNPTLIAGTAVRVRAPLPQHTASAYMWIDSAPSAGARYWLEDISLSGARTMHGPVQAAGVMSRREQQRIGLSPLLTDMRSGYIVPSATTLTVTRPALDMGQNDNNGMNFSEDRTGRGQRSAEFVTSATLAGQPAVKIAISQEGWYRVTQAQLLAAGLDPRANLNTLRVINEGTEIPIRVLRQHGALSAIEFYGIGLDDQYTDTRIYWLIWGGDHGLRLQSKRSGHADFESAGYMAAAERHDRTFYFAALTTNGDNDNFFGDVVTGDPVDEHLQITGVDQNDASTAQIDLTLQGVTDPATHDVQVALNGFNIGEIVFSGMSSGALVTEVPVDVLKDGDNIITLTALGGDDDITLVDHVIVTFLRTYASDHDQLRFTVPAQSACKVTGFSNSAVHVIRLDSPMTEVDATVTQEKNGTYSVMLNNGSNSPGVYFTYADDVIAAPLALNYHAPVSLSAHNNAADLLIVSHSTFIPALAPLVAKRQQQGLKVKVVDIDDVYSEFNYGEHNPYALRKFLQTAVANWSTAPRWLLLVGDASVDPRNFLGFGYFDFVPTKIVATAQLKTASDAWFSDFDDSGFEQIATGRLPVRTLDDASLVVSKILAYEAQSPGTWSNTAYLVADQNVGADFQNESAKVAGMLPQGMTVAKLNVSDPGTDHITLINQLNAGNLIVNYLGHGSVQDWSTPRFFNADDATALRNGAMAPFFITMDCFNGFFHDVYQTSLAETLLLAPQGGAVAVWGSSALTDSTSQFGMDESVMEYLFANPAQTIGEATKNAKQGVADEDVRRSWILFGDPSMKLKSAGN